MNENNIFGLDIRPYIHESRNCRPSGSGYVIQNGNSSLSLNLNSFDGNFKITLLFKRINGNGNIFINDKKHQIISKLSQKIELEFVDDYKFIKITRDQSCSGKIIICGFSIISLDETNDVVDNMPNDWKNIIKQCGHVKGIKLVQGKLLAVEGAYIQRADLIESIITDPPKAVSIGDNIKFTYPCQILSINLKSEITSKPIKPLYQHMQAPTKINSAVENKIEAAPGIQYANPQAVTRITGTTNNTILYDSYSRGLMRSTLQSIYDITEGHGQSEKGLLLGRFARFGIPILSVQPHVQHVIVINTKKVSGNGKLGLRFASTDGNKRSQTILICPEKPSELYIKLNSEDPPAPGASYILEFFRPENSTVGELIIDRIMVIRGITVSSMHVSDTPKHEEYKVPQSSITYDISLFDYNDDIEAISKKYARRISDIQSDIKFDHVGGVVSSIISGLNWFSKIKCICPNLSLKTFTNIDENNLVIGQLGALVRGNKIWLDVFNKNTISENDDNILKQAKLIISPSLQNVEFLKQHYKSANILYLEKPWPIVNSKTMPLPNKEYVLYIHRDYELTKRLIESWEPSFPKLMIVGFRGILPNYVIPLNEYITYDYFLQIIIDAKAIIDLSPNDNYLSAFLSVAFDLGLPVLTNNWFGLNYENCKFILYRDKVNDLNFPTLSDLKNNILDVLSLNKLSVNVNHNDKLKSFLNYCY